MRNLKVRNNSFMTKNSLIVFLLACIFLGSCNSNENQPIQKQLLNVSLDTTNVLLKYENTLLCIPSPYQIAVFLKKNNISFNEEHINPIKHYKKYNNNFKRSINLGIYGADLSYLNIYKQSQDALIYIAGIKELSDQLGLSPAFKEDLLIRIEANLENEDSLLSLLSHTYRNANSYLKSNDREDMGTLIITGGWIESLYILSQNALENPNNRELINRIGEQKHPLKNLVKLLSPFYFESPEYGELIDALYDLTNEFEGIIYTYAYQNPVIDTANKISIINSSSKVTLSEYHLRIIAKKVKTLRTKLIS